MGIGNLLNGIAKIPGTKEITKAAGQGMEGVEKYTGLSKEQQMMLAANVGGLVMDVMTGNPVGAVADVASIYGDLSGNEQISNYADAVGAVAGIGSSLKGMAKQGVKQAAKQAGKQMTKRVLAQTAKTAGKEVAMEGIEQTAKTGLKTAAKQAGKQFIPELTKGVAKSAAPELAKAGLQNAARGGTQVATQAIAEEATKAAVDSATAAVPTTGQALGSAFQPLTGTQGVTANSYKPLTGGSQLSELDFSGAPAQSPVGKTLNTMFPGQDLKSMGPSPLAQGTTNYGMKPGTSMKDVFSAPSSGAAAPNKTFQEKVNDIFKKTDGFKEKYVDPAAEMYGAYNQIKQGQQEALQMTPQAQQMLAQIRSGAQNSAYNSKGTVASRIAQMHRGY